LDATESQKDWPIVSKVEPKDEDEYWRWRLSMAEQIALQIDPERFGVKEFYVFGSTKNATARPVSDIDLLIHFDGTDKQRAELLHWLEGWSLCLSEINYLRTGYKTKGLLDVHLVSEDDIKNKRSFAVKIGAITDPARPLPMGKSKAQK
jgi:predicted nucleotidyltransferase